MVVEDEIRGFIIDRFHWNPSSGELTADYPLIDSNLVDSLGIYQIVSFLEAKFGIEVLDEELDPANFGTIGGLVALVESKKNSSVRSGA